MGKYRNLILGTTALVGLAATGTSAFAAGLEIREQSAWGQGASYAGVAAGGSVSSMFWNPATITQTGKFALEASGSLIFPQASQTGTAALFPSGTPLPFTDGTPNSGQDAFVLASYTTIQLTDRIWAGVAINSPFGLETAFENPNWAGAFYGQSSTLHTYNATSMIAIKLTDWLSIGGGFQAERGQVNLKFATGFPSALTGGQIPLAQAQGHGWGFGWTAGATITPTPTTQVGFGYRSGLDQEIKGNLDTGAADGFGTPGTATTTIKLPGIASLGVRQGLTTQLTLLGTVEWTNWSRIGTSTLTQANGAPALAPSGAPIQVPFQWRDNWFYSLGLEYAVAPAWTLRGGVAYETNAIPEQVRVPLVPDNNRMWYSVGATNNIGAGFKVDLAYSFIDVKNAPINIVPGNPSFNGLVTYTGSSRGNVSIFSVGVKYITPPPPPPVSTRG